jgi:1-acyl-sn-glycerol-3-phosphate acyltransferase
MSFLDSARAASLTLRIIVPTLTDSARGTLSEQATDQRLSWWSRRMLDDAGAELTVVGREHLPAKEPLVMMSNHRSYYDIPVVFQAAPGSVRMVGKKELFRVPLFGPAMRAAGFIEVNRQHQEAARASLKRSQELIARGLRVWIAPEGTRTKTGKLGPFKAGGFHLALDSNVRILPIAIEGTERVLSADSFEVQKGAKLKATILPPVDAPSYGHARRKELMADVRNAIAKALGES